MPHLLSLPLADAIALAPPTSRLLVKEIVAQSPSNPRHYLSAYLLNPHPHLLSAPHLRHKLLPPTQPSPSLVWRKCFKERFPLML